MHKQNPRPEVDIRYVMSTDFRRGLKQTPSKKLKKWLKKFLSEVS